MGADAGFASIIGLAILVLLYFAQARETASLREQAELAAQRVAQLESRLAAQAAAVAASTHPASGFQAPPGIIPTPGYQPAPVFAAAATPAPPAGVAAPPLSAATKLIPTPPAVGMVRGVAAAGIAGLMGRSPAAAPRPAPGTPGQVPGQGPAQAPFPAAPGHTAPTPGQTVASPGQVASRAQAPNAPGAPGQVASPAQAPNAPGAPAQAPVQAPGGPPPMNRIVTPRPATAAGGAAVGAATATNGTGEHPVIPLPAPVPTRPPVQIRPGSGGGSSRPRMLSELADNDDSPSDITRVLMAHAAVAVVAAIVVVLISVTSGSGTNAPTSSHSSTSVSNAPTASHHHRTTPKVAPINNASVTVAVLNGTAVYKLANSVATQLGAAGFKQGTVANAATQTQPSTTVMYVPGDQRQAAAVARNLKLSSSAVQAIDANTQALGCPAAGSCNVVVTVGADLANSSTQTSTAG